MSKKDGLDLVDLAGWALVIYTCCTHPIMMFFTLLFLGLGAWIFGPIGGLIGLGVGLILGFILEEKANDL